MRETVLPHFRIATWNLERPTNVTDARFAAIRKRLSEVNADIWILTETHSSLALGLSYEGRCTDQLETIHEDGECRTAIWTRCPILQDIKTYDSTTAACCEIDCPAGPILVYGTIIPYGGAGTKHGYWFNGELRTEAKAWQLHYESIEIHQAEWARLREDFPNHYICVAGDFNQSRDNHRWGKSRRQWYGTNKGRNQLSRALEDNGLCCVSEVDFVEDGQLTTRSSVDHLCLSQELAIGAQQVNAFEAGKVGDRRISDHNGVSIDLVVESMP